MKRGLLLISTALAGLAGTAEAQTIAPPETEDGAIGEIVVTAQRREESLSDVGMTIGVVGADDIQRLGIADAADLAKAVPGITVAKNGDGTPIYALRGVSFNSTDLGAAPTVSVYVDEMPVPFSVMTQGVLLDLERVEVLKGPQGTLYGQNSTAGAFNYIAAKPTRELSYGLSASYGRFDAIETNGFVSGPISETLAARVAARIEDAGPWQKSVTRDDKVGAVRRYAGRLLLDWTPSDALRASLNLNGWIDRSDSQAPQLVMPNPANPALAAPGLVNAPRTISNAREADWDPGVDYRKDNGFYQAGLRVEADLSDTLTLTSISSFARASIDGITDLDGTPLTVQRQTLTGNVKAINQELRLAGEAADGRVRYILGGSYQYDKTRQDGLLNTPLLSATAGLGIDSSVTRGVLSNRNYGLFANVDFDVTDELSISGGIRKAWVKHKADTCSADSGDGTAAAAGTFLSAAIRDSLGLPGSTVAEIGNCITMEPLLLSDGSANPDAFLLADPNKRLNEDNLSWRVNVDYKPARDMLLYASVSRGYKAGIFPVVSAVTTDSLRPVLQEELTAYEVGTKAKFFDRRVALNLSAFYYDYRDKQLQTIFNDPILGKFFTTRNVDKSSVKGFDADITVVPVEGMTFRSAVTYADSKVKKAGGAQSIDASGNPVSIEGAAFSLAPKWTWVNDVDFRPAVNPQWNALFGGTVTYNSATSADLTVTPAVAIRAFTTVDLRAGLESADGRWRIMAFGRNVFNEYYWNFTFVAGDAILRFPNRPATYGLLLSYRY